MDHLRLKSGAEMTETVCARNAFFVNAEILTFLASPV